MKKAWATRVEKYHDARLEFETRHVDKSDPDAGGVHVHPHQPKGADGLDYTTSTLVLVSDRKMRVEVRGRRPLESKLLDQTTISTFDESESRVLFSENNDIPYPQGYVLDFDYCQATSTWGLEPVSWTFTPTQPATAHYNVESMSFLKQEEVDGRDCWLIQEKLDLPPGAIMSGGTTRLFWLDPDQDFSIVRHTQGSTNRVLLQLDCKYQIAEGGDGDLWIPEEWTSWRFNADGTPWEIAHSIVTDYEINPPFDSSAFRVEFPAGTIVSDNRPSDQNGRTGTDDYLVRKDGSHRTITWDERFLSYEELLATDTGASRRLGDSSRSMGWLIGFNILIAITVLLLFAAKRFRRNRSVGEN